MLIQLERQKKLRNSYQRETRTHNRPIESTAKVKMIHTVRIPANHAAIIPVQINGNTGLLLLKPDPVLTKKLGIGDSLMQLKDNDTIAITIVTPLVYYKRERK